MGKKTGLAIVTYGTNYGTYLQAFATQYFVQKMGYDTEVINMGSVAREVSASRKKYFIKQIFNIPELKSYSHVIKGIIKEKTDKSYGEYIANRKIQFEKFRSTYFKFSPICNSWNGLTEYCKLNYDNVVVGSDQLWRPANIAGDFYTLNFVPDCVNKIAYATSFGLKDIRNSQREITTNFLKKINHLSVREESGALIVKELTGRSIPVVVDPTLLLNSKEWLQFVDKRPIIDEKYILCYLLGDNPDHRKFVNELAEQTGCKIVGILHVAGYIPGDGKLADIVLENIGPFEFLNLIKNAEFVCTDSFHGCVFAIQFEKKLFAFRRFSDKNKMSTNDRITTLFHTTKMEKRLIYGDENVEMCVNDEIDYLYVEQKLAEKRREALNYLEKAFSDQKTDS